MTPSIFIIACLIAVVALLWAEKRDNVRLRWLTKPTASAAFVLVALSGGALNTGYGHWILAALIFCMLGDIFLIPSGRRTFLAGMAAFAAGHGAYTGAFLSSGAEISTLFLFGAAGMIVFALISLRWLWPHLDEFCWPVTFYTIIIATMVAASLIAAPPGNMAMAPYWLVIAGALGFAISDLAVARDRFVAHQFSNKLWGLPLYYGAQLMLAASV